MNAIAWPCPAPGGPGEELALVAGPDGAPRLLIVPALFEEANRTRRTLAQAMRALAARGVASVLPDLPGCNESLASLEAQDLSSWRTAIAAAAEHFGATRVLSVRGGAVIAPDLPGWRLAPLTGASALRQLVRARIVASKEAGRAENTDALLAEARAHGIELAGNRLGAQMVRDLENDGLPDQPRQAELTLEEVAGSALWLRGEPGDDPAMAEGIAGRIAAEMRA